MTTNTFHFTRNPQLGRAIGGSKLYAAGQQTNAADLDAVKHMAQTDKAAHRVDELLETFERYSANIRFYDGRPEDYNSQPGKVAVSDATVRGTIDVWNYRAEAVMEFDPVSKETLSLEAQVQNSPAETFRMSTGDNGIKELTYSNSWGKTATLHMDDKNGTITAIV